MLPAAGAPAAAASAASADTAQTTPTPAATAASGVPWRWIALGSFGLWLVTVLAWWWLRRARPASRQAAAVSAPASQRERRAAFLAAARGSDAAAQANALLAWAQLERPGLVNLGALAEALASTPQREAIDALQKQRYAAAGGASSGDRLAAAFRDGFQWRVAPAAPADGSGLPPLYPFKLD